jgi:hypothetical protein
VRQGSCPRAKGGGEWGDAGGGVAVAMGVCMHSLGCIHLEGQVSGSLWCAGGGGQGRCSSHILSKAGPGGVCVCPQRVVKACQLLSARHGQPSAITRYRNQRM